MEKLLILQNIHLSYHTKEFETKAIEDLSFSLSSNDFVSIVGPSGCGKTTILSLIAGLLKPSCGKIYFENKEISSISQNVGYMFQQDNLFEWLTVEQNILFGLKLQKKLTKESRNFALSLIEKYGLNGFLHHYPSELSGGMRQRVSLIRTLATSPSLLLLDEPFSALDYQTRINVQEMVHSIILNEHKTAILVTHDISEAVVMSDRVIVLTKRPASIKKEFNLDFEKSLSPLKRRELPNFNIYFNEIWEELKT